MRLIVSFFLKYFFTFIFYYLPSRCSDLTRYISKTMNYMTYKVVTIESRKYLISVQIISKLFSSNNRIVQSATYVVEQYKIFKPV